MTRKYRRDLRRHLGEESAPDAILLQIQRNAQDAADRRIESSIYGGRRVWVAAAFAVILIAFQLVMNPSSTQIDWQSERDILSELVELDAQMDNAFDLNLMQLEPMSTFDILEETDEDLELIDAMLTDRKENE